MSFDLKADPAKMNQVGGVIVDNAETLRTEAKKLISIVEALKSTWQDEANVIFVNDATEYIRILNAIIDALENHGIYIQRTGARIGGVVDNLKNRWARIASRG